MILAIDPDTKFCGFALGYRDKLYQCGVVKTAAGELNSLTIVHPISSAIIEMPCIRRNSDKEIRDRDILALTRVVGRWEQVLELAEIPAELVAPVTWKQTVKKPVTERRLLVTNKGKGPILSPEEIATIPGDLTAQQREDCLDAVGILMYKLGRY